MKNRNFMDFIAQTNREKKAGVAGKSPIVLKKEEGEGKSSNLREKL
jgi:hypothetical protein